MAAETPARRGRPGGEGAGRTGGLDEELHGLDVLETPRAPARPLALRAFSATWPKLAAAALAIAAWQLVVWSGWRPEHTLPGPAAVFETAWERVADGTLPQAAWITIQRAVNGFALALAIGVALGALVARVQVARVAFGSFITGLQTMPSIAWFPAAILLFGLNEQAIAFVVVIGAAPSIANGLISGIDHIPPLWLRAGRILGARGLTLFRTVVLPASLPSFVAGLKQGWAFAWRSLMAGELLVVIAGRPSLGFQLQFAREMKDVEVLYATMLAILVIGIVVDILVFGRIERTIRRRRGLLEEA